MIDSLIRTSNFPKFAMLILTSATLAVGCGSSQNQNRGGTNCATPAEGMTPLTWNAWAQCVSQNGAQTPDGCVDALRWSRSATPEALAAATACSLRSDGTSQLSEIGEALGRESGEQDKLLAIVGVFGEHFVVERHGNVFAASLPRSARLGIRENWADIDDASQHKLLQLAFRYNLAEITEAVDSAATSSTLSSVLSEQDASAYSSQYEGAETLTATQRWAHARSGYWDASDVADCFRGTRRGCADWSGPSPLLLLTETHAEGATAMSAGVAAQAVTDGPADVETTGVVVAWLNRPDVPNREPLNRTLMLRMTDAQFPVDRRMAIAENAGEVLCDVEMVRNATARVETDPDGVLDAYLRQCLSNVWTAEQTLSVAGLGSELTAPDAFSELMEASLRDAFNGVTCDEVVQTATAAEEAVRSQRISMAGLSVVAAYDVREDCFSRMTTALERLANSDDEHPESRLRAIQTLASNGVTATCSQIAEAMQWRPSLDENSIGITDAARDAEREAREACELR